MLDELKEEMFEDLIRRYGHEHKATIEYAREMEAHATFFELQLLYRCILHGAFDEKDDDNDWDYEEEYEGI